MGLKARLGSSRMWLRTGASQGGARVFRHASAGLGARRNLVSPVHKYGLHLGSCRVLAVGRRGRWVIMEVVTVRVILTVIVVVVSDR